jgi:hypothetical protein
VQVQVQKCSRCADVSANVQSGRCAVEVQKCRGADVQRCRGGAEEVLRSNAAVAGADEQVQNKCRSAEVKSCRSDAVVCRGVGCRCRCRV